MESLIWSRGMRLRVACESEDCIHRERIFRRVISITMPGAISLIARETLQVAYAKPFFVSCLALKCTLLAGTAPRRFIAPIRSARPAGLRFMGVFSLGLMSLWTAICAMYSINLYRIPNSIPGNSAQLMVANPTGLAIERIPANVTAASTAYPRPSASFPDRTCGCASVPGPAFFPI